MLAPGSQAFYAALYSFAEGSGFTEKYGARLKFISGKEPYLQYRSKETDELNDILELVSHILQFYHCKK